MDISGLWILNLSGTLPQRSWLTSTPLYVLCDASLTVSPRTVDLTIDTTCLTGGGALSKEITLEDVPLPVTYNDLCQRLSARGTRNHLVYVIFLMYE